MIKFIKLCTILLLGVSFKTFAVDPAFIVFYNSGKAIKLIEGKSVVLKKGDHLQSDDQISIPEKTQLVLVCANFSVVQLKNKTKFTVKSLVSKCDRLVTSASSAYFKYMWNSFAHEHVAPEKNPRSFMKTYGAASRSSNVVPKVSLDTIIYYNEPLNIGWLPAKSIQINRIMIMTLNAFQPIPSCFPPNLPHVHMQQVFYIHFHFIKHTKMLINKRRMEAMFSIELVPKIRKKTNQSRNIFHRLIIIDAIIIIHICIQK